MSILFPVGSPFKKMSLSSCKSQNNKITGNKHNKSCNNTNLNPTPFETVSLSLPDLTENNESSSKKKKHNNHNSNVDKYNNSNNSRRRSSRLQNKTSKQKPTANNNAHSDIICDITTCHHPNKKHKVQHKKNIKQKNNKDSPKPNDKNTTNTKKTQNKRKAVCDKEEMDHDDDNSHNDNDINNNNDNIDDEETESEDDGDDLYLLGHEWGDNTDLSSKRLIKELESKILKRVDIINDGFKQNAWYMYVDVDANDKDKIWVNRSKEHYKPKICIFATIKYFICLHCFQFFLFSFFSIVYSKIMLY